MNLEAALPLDHHEPWRLVHIEHHALRCELSTPLVNSFRSLTARESLLVRVVDDQGHEGWGEIWCNYPPGGVRHRAHLLSSLVAPLAMAAHWTHPAALFSHLERALHVPALQCGEPGPFAQVVAGLDCAVWDMIARRSNKPLWQLYGGSNEARAYASGLAGTDAARLAASAVAQGFAAVKVKVGLPDDLQRLAAVREAVGPGVPMMVDANQRWTPEQAAAQIRDMEAFDPYWVEEPIAADLPPQAWIDLQRSTQRAMAAGENIRGLDGFLDLAAPGAIQFVQPDPGKWGGVTGGRLIARQAAEHGAGYAPHWLGGAVGLLHAMHLAAGTRALNAPKHQWLEFDVNENALRIEWLPEAYLPRLGLVCLGTAPGLGFEPSPQLLLKHAT